jgi:hypothetical protein
MLLASSRRILSFKTAGKDAFAAGRYEDAVRSYTNALLVDFENKTMRAILFNNRAMCYLQVRFLSPCLSRSFPFFPISLFLPFHGSSV